MCAAISIPSIRKLLGRHDLLSQSAMGGRQEERMVEYFLEELSPAVGKTP
jgi:hypothetical protein